MSTVAGSLGVTTSEAKRQGLVALARRHGFLVVADEAGGMLLPVSGVAIWRSPVPEAH